MCFSCPTAQCSNLSSLRIGYSVSWWLQSLCFTVEWTLKGKAKNKKLVPVTFQKQSSHRLRGRMSGSEHSHLSGPVTVIMFFIISSCVPNCSIFTHRWSTSEQESIAVKWTHDESDKFVVHKKYQQCLNHRASVHKLEKRNIAIKP